MYERPLYSKARKESAKNSRRWNKATNVTKKTYCFTFPKLLLSTIKVKIDIKTFQELSDGVLVCVRLLLYNFHKVLEYCSSTFVGDNSCCQVPQDVGAGGLDRIKIPTRMKKIMSGKEEYISYRTYIPVHIDCKKIPSSDYIHNARLSISQAKFLPSTVSPKPPWAGKTREQLLKNLW